MCGIYLIFELAQECLDFSMTWYERRLPVYMYLIGSVYSTEDKTAPLKDENGRELPDWLREAEEKELAAAEEKLPKMTRGRVIAEYLVNYGIKSLLLMAWFRD